MLQWFVLQVRSQTIMESAVKCGAYRSPDEIVISDLLMFASRWFTTYRKPSLKFQMLSYLTVYFSNYLK